MGLHVAVVIPVKHLSHAGANLALLSQLVRRHIGPGHHGFDQALHVYYRGQEQALLQIAVPVGQETEISAQAAAEQADVIPAGTGVLHHGFQIPAAFCGLAGCGVRFPVPVFRQVKAQHLVSSGNRITGQQFDHGVGFVGHVSVNCEDQMLRGRSPDDGRYGADADSFCIEHILLLFSPPVPGGAVGVLF